jgi:hypothetical protein
MAAGAPPELCRASTEERARLADLASAGIPASVPIRVAANGWPTGTNPLNDTHRSPSRQAEVIDAVVRTMHRLREELNIPHYMQVRGPGQELAQ